MRFRLFIFCIISGIFCGCSSLRDLDSPSYKEIRSQVFIGELGVYKNGIWQNDFKSVGAPELKKPIRLSVNEKAFSKAGYKNYFQITGKENIAINDSVFQETRPVYYEMEIADRVGYIESVNKSREGKLLEYLLQTENNLAVMGASLVFPEPIRDKLRKASEVYLIDLAYLTYGLKLINQDQSFEIINFSEGTSLGHIFSSICWTKNYRGDHLVGAFTNSGTSCPGDTKNQIRKLYEKDVFEKL